MMVWLLSAAEECILMAVLIAGGVCGYWLLFRRGRGGWILVKRDTARKRFYDQIYADHIDSLTELTEDERRVGICRYEGDEVGNLIPWEGGQWWKFEDHV